MTGQSRVRQRDKGHPLAGSSTLNRCELGRPEQAAKDRYKRIVGAAQQLDRLLVQLFIEMQAAEPEELVLDIDASDDPLHGEQEGRYFHGYYDCYCYLPLYVTCGRHVLSGQLRTADVDPAVGALADVQRIVAQLRERWPQVRLLVRAELESHAARGGQGSMAAGAGPQQQPAFRGELYEQLDCARGDMENRSKEQQLDLCADRTSASALRANQLRLQWALFTAALLEQIRSGALAGTELAQAQCGTLRVLLFKVAASVRVSVRRIRVPLSSLFPRQELFAHCLARLRAS